MAGIRDEDRVPGWHVPANLGDDGLERPRLGGRGLDAIGRVEPDAAQLGELDQVDPAAVKPIERDEQDREDEREPRQRGARAHGCARQKDREHQRERNEMELVRPRQEVGEARQGERREGPEPARRAPDERGSEPQRQAADEDVRHVEGEQLVRLEATVVGARERQPLKALLVKRETECLVPEPVRRGEDKGKDEDRGRQRGRAEHEQSRAPRIRCQPLRARGGGDGRPHRGRRSDVEPKRDGHSGERSSRR